MHGRLFQLTAATAAPGAKSVWGTRMRPGPLPTFAPWKRKEKAPATAHRLQSVPTLWVADPGINQEHLVKIRPSLWFELVETSRLCPHCHYHYLTPFRDTQTSTSCFEQMPDNEVLQTHCILRARRECKTAGGAVAAALVTAHFPPSPARRMGEQRRAFLGFAAAPVATTSTIVLMPLAC